MALARSLLLAASQNAWLQRNAPRWGFVKRSVARFMPGETLDEALAAAAGLRPNGLTTILTCLGENVATAVEADAVERHYDEAIGLVESRGLDAQISVKLTQLGLDFDADGCTARLLRLMDRAAARR